MKPASSPTPARPCHRAPGFTSSLLPSFLALALSLSAAAGGCDSVSSQSIQTWKDTQKGPGKLQAALANPKVDPRLRAEAAVALVDIGMADQMESALAGASAADRAAVVKEAIPLFAQALEGDKVERAREARDALFGLRAMAAPAEQSQIDATLLAALEKDLRAGRTAGGRHSIDKILVAIGPAAGPVLVKVLAEPAAPVPAIVDVLTKVGDESTRDQAGGVLVAKASAVRGPIPVPLWRALGDVGGPTVNEFLKKKVESGNEAEAVAAAQALQARGEPSLLPLALKVAGDPRANKTVRDEMFGLAERIGGSAARDGLLRIIASDKEELVRYRAYEAALAVGKEESVVPALEAFPTTHAYKRDDVVDFLVKDILKIGPGAKGVLGKALGSSSPLARMAAVLTYESLGTQADAPAVSRLAGDKGSVKGFPAGVTVGREASRVADVLQKKKG
jgi:hypothetical protein